MNRTEKLIVRRVLAFAFLASILVAAPHFTGPRDVPLIMPACATCGHATPITITCDGLDWQIYKAGTVQDMAASVCPAGSHYTWKVMP